MRQRLLNTGILMLLLLGAVWAQEGNDQRSVVFEVYPPNAEIYRQTVNRERDKNSDHAIGIAGDEIKFDDIGSGLPALVFRADGRRDVVVTIFKDRLQAGIYPEKIYLHPTNPLLYISDFYHLYPVLFFLCLIGLGSGTGLAYNYHSKKKTAENNEAALLALGKEYEIDLGDYTLIKDLGQGAMGLVRLGIRKGSTSESDLVAVKTVILPTSESLSQEEKDTQSETTVARFRREAKILTEAVHPNIMQLYDWGENDKGYYIVTEYLKGQDFREYMDQTKVVPLEDVQKFFYQMSGALTYLHDQGVFHRDLKPANIRRSPSGDAKIIDFGLATSPQQSKEITVQGAIQGTLLYMAPEHLQGQKQDALYDQFALGAILFEMLAGRPPVDELEEENLGFMQVFTHYTAPRHPLSKFRDDLGSEVAAVIDRMLQPTPAARFPTVGQAYEAFEAAAGSCSELLKK